MGDSLTAEFVTYTGNDGDEVEAYVARPTDAAPSRGGVVVIHHLPGWDRWSKEVTRRFAVLGYDAICPNLYTREAPGATPQDAAAKVMGEGGVPDPQVVGDAAGAAAYLRALPTSNGKTGVVGYCSGGRHAVLIAANTQVDAVVDCYGGFVTRSVPPESGYNMVSIAEQLPGVTAPVLGLFGNDDTAPNPQDVDDLDRILTEQGTPHEFHRYDGAAHAFFNTDRDSFRADAALDGWQRVEEFFGRHLS